MRPGLSSPRARGLDRAETRFAVADCVASAVADGAAQSPDWQLLLCCARGVGVDGARIHELAHQVLDWDALVEAAEFHGLAAILFYAVTEASLDLVPPDVASRLRNICFDSARQNLILTSQLLALLDAFAAHGIAVVPLKGPVMAESLYPDPAQRPSSDLDLLVRSRDVAGALRVLAQQGYALGANMQRLPLRVLLRLNCELFFHRHRMADVDLQWETGPAHYPFRIEPEMLWRSLGRTRIAGREVPCLSREALLLFLCVHGTKHMWSRLQWLGDVARLVRKPLAWDAVLQLAEEAGCMRPLLLGLSLAHELLEAPVPENILQRARAEQAVPARARQVALRLMRIPPSEPHSWELTTFNARMAERTWDKVRHLAALLKAPTDRELEWLLLPEWLFFLYYPLRIARLAKKCASRLVRGRSRIGR
jgi:hypothetical protein